MCSVALFCATGCNAVFGVDDLFFGEGAGGATSGQGGMGGDQAGGEGGLALGGSGSSNAGGEGGSMPPDLVGDALVCRYFMDEGESGSLVKQLEDAAPQPEPLPVATVNDGELRYVTVREGMGVGWQGGVSGGPRRDLTMSKLSTALSFNNTVTLELVVRMSAYGGAARRPLIFAGLDDQQSYFSFSTDNQFVGFVLDVWGEPAAAWPINGDKREVLHVVWDIKAQPQTLLYRNGVPEAPFGSAEIRDADVVTEGVLALGHSGVGGASMRGDLYYAAVYATALDDASIVHNAERLLLNDDH
jgi:hypothetical protein